MGRSPPSSTPPSPRSALMWWSRCAQKRMLEPTSSDTLLVLSWEPSLDLALSSVMLRLRPMPKLTPTPSSLESSALLTTLLPPLATLLALLDLLPLQLPQLLLPLAQSPSPTLLPLLLLAMLLHLLLLLQLLLHLLLLLRLLLMSPTT